MPLYQPSFLKSATSADINPNTSNQHELHGVSQLKAIFGEIDPNDGTPYPYVGTVRIHNSGEKYPISLTWYNARANHATRNEYRLYYDAGSANLFHQLTPGADILIGKTASGAIEVVLYPTQRSGYHEWTNVVV